MVSRHVRWSARTWVLALAFVVLAAQVGWARAAVCGEARLTAHDGCKCCEERETPAASFIRTDCCGLEESRHTRLVPADPMVSAARPPIEAPPGAFTVTPAFEPVVTARVFLVEARIVGPPLWLRIRSLRL